MYPTLYHFLKDTFGLEIELFKFVNSFGFFVVLGIFMAALTLSWELKRRTSIGQFPKRSAARKRGNAPPLFSYVLNAALGFFAGYKLIPVFLGKADMTDPPAYLSSTEGSLIGGVIGLIFLLGLMWRQYSKEKKLYPEPTEVVQEITAREHAGALAMRAAIWGFIGAKVFYLIEDWDRLVRFFTDFSIDRIMSGLTIYGGLLFGGVAVILYFRKHGFSLLRGADSAAPGVMLAYGIGRLGCHFSGDGDWGVANSLPKPSYLPDWLWSYRYPNNVNAIIGPDEKGGYVAKRMTEDMEWAIFDGYGTYLDPGVWPTPVYEFLMASVIFSILWSLRKRLNIAGMMFALYMCFVGIERLFIEKYRVNDDHEFLGILATQAEFISVGVITAGILSLIYLYSKSKKANVN